MENYEKLYTDFLTLYKTGMCSGEEIGEIIVRLAHCYAKANLDMITKERSMNLVARETEGQTDVNGKAISSTKAKVFVDATSECFSYNVARGHLQNIEAYINALKSLQKGVLNEFSHLSN